MKRARTLYLYVCNKNEDKDFEITKFNVIPDKEISAGFYLDALVQKELISYGFYSNPIPRNLLDQIQNNTASNSFSMISLNGENQTFFIQKISEYLKTTIDQEEQYLILLKQKRQSIDELLSIFNNAELIYDSEEDMDK